jgi:8-oxo-dGTP pyrophosphatase MutT (NUDIX family)
MIKDKRPTFYTDEGQPIRAAGILCYVYDHNKNKKIWLFRKQSNKFSDTGGKTDMIDENPLQTAIRETVEETNGHLFSKNHNNETCTKILVRELKKQNPKPIYVESCKYLVIPFRLRFKNFKLSLDRFGEMEIHDHLEHSYHWLEDIPKTDLHPRLISIRNILTA